MTRKFICAFFANLLVATSLFSGEMEFGKCDLSGTMKSVPALNLLGMVLLVTCIVLSGSIVLLRKRRRGSRLAFTFQLLLAATLLGSSGVWAHVVQTSGGVAVPHRHPSETLSDADKKFRDAAVDGLIPGDREILDNATTTYNCHGKSFDGEASWIDNPDLFLDDDGAGPKTGDYVPVSGAARLGDIIVYRHNGMITHSGVVTGINAAGEVVEVCSKWGEMSQYRHKPDEVLQGQSGMVNGRRVRVTTYGTSTVYRRR